MHSPVAPDELAGAIRAEVAGIGADSIEHGRALGHSELEALCVRGGAWTPTLCAVLQERDSPDPAVRIRIGELRERLRDRLPYAVAHGVRVLAGPDVIGTIADEIALLADHGLAARIVTYNDDPLEDPGVLARPAAVVVRGVRVRLRHR
jgi:imidazolonepropionase-like amidohydrolase